MSFYLKKSYDLIDSCVSPVLGNSLFALYDCMRRFVWRSSKGNSVLSELYRNKFLACRISQNRLGNLVGIVRRQTVMEYIRQMEHLGWIKTLRPDRCCIYVLGEIDADGYENFHQDDWVTELRSFVLNKVSGDWDGDEGEEVQEAGFVGLAIADRKKAVVEFLRQKGIVDILHTEGLEGREVVESPPKTAEEVVRSFLSHSVSFSEELSPTKLREVMAAKRIGPKWLDRDTPKSVGKGKENTYVRLAAPSNVRLAAPDMSGKPYTEVTNTEEDKKEEILVSDQISDQENGSLNPVNPGIDRNSMKREAVRQIMATATDKAQTTLQERRARAKAKADRDLKLSSKIPEQRRELIRAVHRRWAAYDAHNGNKTRWLAAEVNIVNLLASAYDTGEELLGLVDYLLSRWESINNRYLKGKGLGPSLSLLYKFHASLSAEAKVYSEYKKAIDALNTWTEENPGQFAEASLSQEVQKAKLRMEAIS